MPLTHDSCLFAELLALPLTIPTNSNVSVLTKELSNATACPWLSVSEFDELQNVSLSATPGPTNNREYFTARLISRRDCTTNGHNVFDNPTDAFLFSRDDRKDRYNRTTVLADAFYLPGTAHLFEFQRQKTNSI